jgi:flagellar hook-length control protein FliK
MLSVKLLNTRRTAPAQSPSKVPAQASPEAGGFDNLLTQAQGKHADAAASRHAAAPGKPEPRKSRPAETNDQPSNPEAGAPTDKTPRPVETPEPQTAEAIQEKDEGVKTDEPVTVAAATPESKSANPTEAVGQSLPLTQPQPPVTTPQTQTPPPAPEASEAPREPRAEKAPALHVAPAAAKKSDAPAPDPEIAEPVAEAAGETPPEAAPAKPHSPGKFAAPITEAHERSTKAASFHDDAAAPQSQIAPEPLPQSIAKAVETIAVGSPAPEAAPAEAKSANAGIPLPQGASVALSHDSAPADSAPAAQESPQSTTSETFEQVVLGLKGKLDARTGKAEIRLDPPNLGRVNVSVSLNNGTLTAEFQSASDVVRNLLKDNIDKLKSVLQGQGVAVDRLAVDAPAAPATAGGNSAQQQQSFGSATHDGRSAGQYQQNGRQQQPPAQDDSFARLFRQTQDAPIDMVA